MALDEKFTLLPEQEPISFLERLTVNFLSAILIVLLFVPAVIFWLDFKNKEKNL